MFREARLTAQERLRQVVSYIEENQQVFDDEDLHLAETRVAGRF